MHDRDPRRLKHEQGTPDALVQALQALRKGPDDSARLARAGKRLEHILDAPPPAAPTLEPVAAASPALGRLTPLKVFIGGVAVVAPLLWLARMYFAEPLPPTAAAPSAIQAPAPAPAPAMIAPPAPTAPSVELSAADSSSPKPHARGPLALSKPARKHGSGPARGAEAVTRSTDEAPALSSQPSAASDLQPSAASSQAQVQPSAPKPQAQPQPREEQPAPKPKLAASAPPRAASESELLFDARKALPNDAELALRLIHEHAARFPKGQLVPEREVLAIETLRRLGRMQEADARLKSFQARYPHSLHLQRLQQ